MYRVWIAVFLASFARLAFAGSAAPTLRIDHVDAIPGEDVIVDVRLDSGDAGTVFEISQEVTWDPLTPVRMLANGQPDCFPDIRLGPNLASFTCADEACDSLHAEVKGQELPLGDGPVFGCIFVVDPAAPADDYPVGGSAAMWADADRQLHPANSEGGFIRVASPTPTPTPTATPTAPVAVSVDGDSAPPGGNTLLEFDFADATGRAIDTGFDIIVENAVLDVTAIGEECTLDPRLTNHRLTVLSLGNEDVPAGFSRIRYNVFDVFKPLVAIPSGPLLSCTVPVQPGAPLGPSPIDLQRVFADDLDGLIPGVVGIDGSVVVVVSTETPTVTPTPTPRPSSSCVGDCDGNGVTDVSEAILSIRIALEEEDLELCEAIDANRDGSATANELVMAVDNLIHGCPGGD